MIKKITSISYCGFKNKHYVRVGYFESEDDFLLNKQMMTNNQTEFEFDGENLSPEDIKLML